MAKENKNSSKGMSTLKRWFLRFWKGGANALADEMVSQAIHMARHYSVVEVEVCIPQTRKVLMADP